MRNSLNLRCLSDRLFRHNAALRVDEVRRKEGVDERRLAQTRLACAYVHVSVKKYSKILEERIRQFNWSDGIVGGARKRHSEGEHKPVRNTFHNKVRTIERTNEYNVELEPTLEQLMLNLVRDSVETNIRLRTDLFSHSFYHFKFEFHREQGE